MSTVQLNTQTIANILAAVCKIKHKEILLNISFRFIFDAAAFPTVFRLSFPISSGVCREDDIKCLV